MKVTHYIPMPADDKSRKPQPPPAPYNRKPKFPKPKENSTNPKSSAKASELSSQENLTLHDCIIVIDYYDDHQPMSQKELDHYFANCAEGALIFNQLTYLGICPRRDKMQISTSLHPI